MSRYEYLLHAKRKEVLPMLVIDPRNAFGYRLRDLLKFNNVPYERIKGLAEGIPEASGRNPWPRFSHKTGPGVDGAPVSHRY